RGEVHVLAALLGGVEGFVGRFVVDELPSTFLDAAERRVGTGRVQTLGEEGAPIERQELAERGDDIVEGVGLKGGRAAGAAMEEPAEVVERTMTVGFGAQGRIHVEPQE